ncbi:tagaturonate reductase [Terrisporobacter hibernicus]|uniref:Tagaturonate reductase n=1 Tax=Terrisporobacter hibernicus TaxID=2813371 RepID=A0AAX2ZHU6_9FIRM|nr:tagaturonate reductase [Terrisporobacter hibernicus]UEL48737.1 tagaturonate reductase [Terrisporobacter hibernicus]
MKKINETIEKRYNKYPEKILQFGEGNFLRAFTDWMINKGNKENVYQGSIVLCQPIAPGLANLINDQEGLYTLAMRGIENGQAVEKIEQITSVSRCINPYEDYNALLDIARSADLEVVISNTTEAGISYKEGDKLTDTPPSSFPAKITALLFERYKAFNGAGDKGLLFLPVELIDNNGAELKRIVLQYANEWKLGEEFVNWIETANEFTSTLVDRIVTGYPKDQIDYFEEKLGYKDNLIVTSELFNLWVIEGKKEWSEILPIHKTDANVIWTEDVTPYKKRKVRILNGAHTSTVLAAYLGGHDIVLDFMNDEIFKSYLNKLMFNEIIPTLDLPKEELESFACDVIDRFANPYIKHRLLDISLNSASKFNARCLPSLLEYIEEKNEIPTHLTFSLAAFMKFYQGKLIEGQYMGARFDGTTYAIKDDADVIAFFANTWAKGSAADVAHDVLSNTALWSGKDLSEVAGLENAVTKHLINMETTNMKDLVASL